MELNENAPSSIDTEGGIVTAPYVSIWYGRDPDSYVVNVTLLTVWPAAALQCIARLTASATSSTASVLTASKSSSVYCFFGAVLSYANMVSTFVTAW